MKRRIIEIDEEKCNGCGACAEACHEGAIGMVNGKAKLLRDDYCDGLGDCLPACPTGAISFVEREAAEYDEAAVIANKLKKEGTAQTRGGCPGSAAIDLRRGEDSDDRTGRRDLAGEGSGGEDKLPCGCSGTHSKRLNPGAGGADERCESPDSAPRSMLGQWPVQIKLAPPRAPYFEGAHLLVSADCAAYAYGNFHREFIRNRITLIGCPKLDMVDYGEKLTEILKCNNIKSLSVVRMEVPCCGGIEAAAVKALRDSGKLIPWRVVTISTDGRILED